MNGSLVITNLAGEFGNVGEGTLCPIILLMVIIRNQYEALPIIMKRLLKSVDFGLAKASLVGKRTRSLLPWQRGAGAILLPSNAYGGSLGDEALAISFAEGFQAERSDVEEIGFWFRRRTSTMGPLLESYLPYTIPPYWLASSGKGMRVIAEVLSLFASSFVIGADVVDGCYNSVEGHEMLNYATLAERSGLTSSIISFSISKQPKQDVLAHFKRLPSGVRLVCRDPISKARLSNHLNRTVVQGADLAFLLRPDFSDRVYARFEGWLAERGHGPILGVNWGYEAFRKAMAAGSDPAQVTETLVNFLDVELEKNPDLSVVMLPHDRRKNRELGSDFDIARACLHQLPKHLQSRCFMADEDVSASGIKAICSHLTVAISARMHLAIACLSTGVPVLGISYQDKFEGMFAHFGLDDMCIESEQSLSVDVLREGFRKLLQAEKILRAKIKDELPRVIQLSRQNFVV